MEWPSCSSDLNPIENIWSVLKLSVSKTETKTVQEFVSAIRTSWDNINDDIITNVIESMEKRIKLVIKNKGIQQITN